MIDIAKKAEVTSATVSMALNNHPRISAATKERILRICEELDYHPDPVAKALALSGSDESKSSYLGTIALLESEERFQQVERFPEVRGWHAQLTEICSNAGYKLDHFVVGSTKKEQQSLSRILQTRGVCGLLVYGSNQEIHNWGIDWSRFATVVYGGSLHEHFVHHVMSCSYQDVYDAVIKLHKMGYKRPGYFMVGPYFDHWAAGFSSAFETWGRVKKTPKLVLEGSFARNDQRKIFFDWFQRYEPDVIVANYDEYFLQMLSEKGLRAPDDVGYLCLDVWPSMKHLSGLIQRRDVSYRVMVDLIHGMLMRHEFGPPEQPYCIQIPSIWNEGRTLRRGE